MLQPRKEPIACLLHGLPRDICDTETSDDDSNLLTKEACGPKSKKAKV